MLTTSTIPTWRERWAWAFYDWANSAFILTVVVAFFPIFFRNFWATELPSEQVTLRIGTANSIASFSIMLLAPFLGAIADQGGLKKIMLAAFATLGITATLALSLIEAQQWQWALVAFIVGIMGFLGANIFYDSLLVDVAEEKDFNRVSALGYGLGYLGGALFFTGCVLLTLHPEWFGLTDKTSAVRLSFALTAVWWAIFSIPLFLWVRERHTPNQRPSIGTLLLQSGRDFLTTFQHIRRLRVVGLFLLAYWFYIDGVDTIIVMATDYGKSLGVPDDSLITALLITQFIAFPSALVFGWLGNRLGAKRGILISIVGYILITLGASQLQDAKGFYILAACVGLFQGGIQALSRSLYASLIPAYHAAKFFGFYNMLGKFAAVLGPALVGWVGVMTGSSRLGLASLLVLFIAGGVILWRLPIKPNPS